MHDGFGENLGHIIVNLLFIKYLCLNFPAFVAICNACRILQRESMAHRRRFDTLKSAGNLRRRQIGRPGMEDRQVALGTFTRSGYRGTKGSAAASSSLQEPGLIDDFMEGGERVLDQRSDILTGRAPTRGAPTIDGVLTYSAGHP